MPKVTYTQEELNELFGEEVVVVNDNVRRVTRSDILQKTGIPADFDVEIKPTEVEAIPRANY